jgi:hypothetical protein
MELPLSLRNSSSLWVAIGRAPKHPALPLEADVAAMVMKAFS